MGSLNSVVKKGFTLIELLVVISIIAVLMAVLMPAMNKVREQAKTVVCATNQKQISVALCLLSEDNNDKGPMYYDSYAGRFYNMWIHQIAPYMGENSMSDEDASNETGVMKIIKCPSAKAWTDKFGDGYGYGASDMCWRWPLVPEEDQKIDIEASCALNGWISSYSDQTRKDLQKVYPGRLYGKFSMLNSEVPLLSDGGWAEARPKSEDASLAHQIKDFDGAMLHNPHANVSLARLALDRHNMALNVAFRDTHVSKVPLKELWNYEWHRGFKKTRELKFGSR